MVGFFFGFCYSKTESVYLCSRLIKGKVLVKEVAETVEAKKKNNAGGQWFLPFYSLLQGKKRWPKGYVLLVFHAIVLRPELRQSLLGVLQNRGCFLFVRD